MYRRYCRRHFGWNSRYSGEITICVYLTVNEALLGMRVERMLSSRASSGVWVLANCILSIYPTTYFVTNLFHSMMACSCGMVKCLSVGMEETLKAKLSCISWSTLHGLQNFVFYNSLMITKDFTSNYTLHLLLYL